MHELPYTLTRDDEDIDVILRYSVEPLVPAKTYGPPEDCHPAEGGYVDELLCFNAETDEEIELTKEERRAAVSYVEETHDWSEEDE